MFKVKISFFERILYPHDREQLAKNIKIIIALSLLTHLFAAIYSQGFHKLDEITGVLRYSAYKLGILKESQLISEYLFQIRPWFQPALYTFFGKIYLFFSKEFNPHHFTTILRFFSAALSFLAHFFLAQECVKSFKNLFAKNLSFLTLLLFWCFPYIHARPNSENFASALFILGTTYLLRMAKIDLFESSKTRGVLQISSRPAFAIGLLFGMSFIARFQMSVAIFFTLIWFLFFAKLSIKSFCSILGGILVFFLINMVLDFWGHGQWSVTFYNYFHYNVFKGVASQLGVDPWYQYLIKSFTKGLPPLSVLYFTGVIYLLLKRPLSLCCWIILPFLFVHSIIGHKELRFIWPILPFALLSFAKFADEKQVLSARKFRSVGYLLFSLNLVGLIIVSFRPAYSQIGLYQLIYKKNIKEIYIEKDGLKQFPFFQRGEDLQFNPSTPTQSPYYFLTLNDLQSQREWPKNCKNIYRSYPQFFVDILPSQILQRSKIWGLYFCP